MPDEVLYIKTAIGTKTKSNKEQTHLISQPTADTGCRKSLAEQPVRSGMQVIFANSIGKNQSLRDRAAQN
ncbi:MAG: hypothetical protein Q4E13_04035 [Clostridia bacterium]|nr:hypothetical protein [Clostridia bacterium]